MVTRDEIRDQLWGTDTFVDFEHGVNHAIREIRTALGDDADTPRFVETLPRRGYRFIAPVEQVAEAGPSARRTASEARFPWRLHAAWAAVVVVVALLLWPSRRRADPDPVPPPNPRPVIVLMDSPLPGRVYDPRTEAAGGTNADDLTDVLRSLPVVIQKENTSAEWHREDQVLRQNPDLIVSHLSCLLDARVAGGQQPLHDHLFTLAQNRLVLFFAYVASHNPRTRFLVYSRGAFTDPAVERQWVADAESRLPALRGRLQPFSVPGGREHATFRDPDTARLVRGRVQQILGLR